jgi:hypothetical protein
MTRRTKAQLLEELDALKELSARNGNQKQLWIDTFEEWKRRPQVILSPLPPPPSSGKVALTVLMIVADIAVILVALVFLFRMWLG